MRTRTVAVMVLFFLVLIVPLTIVIQDQRLLSRIREQELQYAHNTQRIEELRVEIAGVFLAAGSSADRDWWRRQQEALALHYVEMDRLRVVNEQLCVSIRELTNTLFVLSATASPCPVD